MYLWDRIIPPHDFASQISSGISELYQHLHASLGDENESMVIYIYADSFHLYTARTGRDSFEPKNEQIQQHRGVRLCTRFIIYSYLASHATPSICWNRPAPQGTLQSSELLRGHLQNGRHGSWPEHLDARAP